MNPVGGGQLPIQQPPQHMVAGHGMGSLAMVHHGVGNPHATVVTMRSSGAGYPNYGGGGQYGMQGGGQYVNPIRMPGGMRMAMAPQQHAPPPHMVHQHGYNNPTVHHGVPHPQGMTHQMVRNPQQQQHMMQPNTMGAHLPQPVARMPMQSPQGGMSSNIMSVRPFGASVLHQEAPLLDPTTLRTSSEQGVSPQQSLQAPTPPPPSQMGQPSLQTQPPHPQQPPQQNLSPMGQTQSPSPQRSQQLSTVPTASATPQNQPPSQQQTQPGEFGQATHPAPSSTAGQLQPQGATQTGSTTLQGLVSAAYCTSGQSSFREDRWQVLVW